jgi:pilus assembly protein CpaB
MKRRGLVLITLSLVLAIGAAWVARNWVQARMNGAPADRGQQVVVAAMEIPFGTKVEARHLSTILLPRDAAVGNHYAKVDDVVGLIALQKIISGEILLKERFADRTAGSTLAAIVKPDMRAVTVRVDDVVGVAGFLMPGNHVDVVAAHLENQRAQTRTVLHDINVLAVDQTASTDKDQPVVVRAVTLEVTPQQAEALVKAREEGKIQLTLRNPLDKNSTPDEPETVATAEPPKPPARKARATQPRPTNSGNNSGVIIIRGTNVHTSESAT